MQDLSDAQVVYRMLPVKFYQFQMFIAESYAHALLFM